jgi:hypothetical protein
MRPIPCLLSSLLILLTTFVAAKASVTIVPLKSGDKTAQDFPFVGSIHNINSGIMGSGVVIGDGMYVITARHVVTHNGEDTGLILEGSNFIFDLGDGGITVERVFGCPDGDIAILKLASKANASTTIYDSSISIGKDFYSAGFGKSCSNASFDKIDWDLPYGTRRIFKNTIQGGIYEITISDTIKIEKKLTFTLRDPCSNTDPAIPGEGIFGPGDSGGGLFFNNNGRLELFATISSLTTQKPYTGFVVDLYSYKKWIVKLVPNAFSENICMKLDDMPMNSYLTFVPGACSVRELVVCDKTRRRKLFKKA